MSSYFVLTCFLINEVGDTELCRSSVGPEYFIEGPKMLSKSEVHRPRSQRR